jgi:hypothetical protein
MFYLIIVLRCGFKIVVNLPQAQHFQPLSQLKNSPHPQVHLNE